MRKFPKGFTLVEALLYIGIVSSVLLVSSILFTTLLETRAKQTTLTEVNEVGMQIMDIITQTARNAEAITAPTTGTSAASLTLDVVTGASDPTIFDLSSSAIRIQEGAGSAVPLNNTSRVTASALTFTNLSAASTPGVIRIQFTLTYVNPSGRKPYTYAKTFTSTAALRQP